MRLLTGIDDRSLIEAPTLDEVAPRLRQFIGPDPIVGQSVEIDLDHLRRQGISFSNPIFDTFELATLLLPRLPTYDLATIARSLHVESSGAHRALADAHSAQKVFVGLLERIHGLEIDLLLHISRLTAGIGWPFWSLFAEAEREARTQLFARALDQAAVPIVDLGLDRVLAPPRDEDEPLIPNAQTRRIDVGALGRALSAGGSVAAVLPAFEERAEQVAMLEAVADAFDRSRHLVVEAGTGTGKSLAYLLPALAYASINSRRVVISTNTINLQDQLFEKDVPDLVEAMGYRVRTSVLKGRANYLCLRRWVALLQSETLAPEEATLLVKTLLWVGGTATGDRAELRLTPEEETAWNRICSQSDACTPLACAHHRDGSCFVARARRIAERSHVVIVNHSLLLSDLIAGSHVIPDYEHLIVDEAHHLEEEATAQLSETVTLRSFAVPLESLAGTTGRATLGTVTAAVAGLRAAGLAQDRADQLARAAGDVRAAAIDAQGTAGDLFDAVSGLIAERSQAADLAGTLRLTAPVRHDALWADIEDRWMALRESIGAVREGAAPIVDELTTAAEAGNTAMREICADVVAALRALDTALQTMQSIVSDPPADVVCWIGTGGTGPGRGLHPGGAPLSLATVSLHRAPLDVGTYLRSTLLEPKSTVVLTSATLSVDGSFDYIRERLGIHQAEEAILGSPFNYRRATLVFLPTDLPEPSEPGYGRRAAEAVANIAEALGGRTLVLFTSNAQLRATREMIRGRMEAAEIVVMSQGIDGSRTRLLQRFRATERALLLGTASFWEGVDVVGEALSALVVARLPFAVPSDPLFAARSEQFEEPFRQYAVPQAILRFKQGFGRLIRSQSDRGIFVVLDRRIASRSYGTMFLNSLPECTVQTGPVATVGVAAMEWLEQNRF